MGIPILQMAKIGAYVVAQTLKGRKRYPLVLMLEPLFRSVGLGEQLLHTVSFVVGFLIFWVRFTFPRFREDQLQAFAWKYLIPISLVNIMATMVFKVAF